MGKPICLAKGLPLKPGLPVIAYCGKENRADLRIAFYFIIERIYKYSDVCKVFNIFHLDGPGFGHKDREMEADLCIPSHEIIVGFIYSVNSSIYLSIYLSILPLYRMICR
jgi:hypothetical protein